MFVTAHTVSPKMDFLDSGSYLMDGIISLNDHILYYELILLTNCPLIKLFIDFWIYLFLICLLFFCMKRIIAIITFGNS